jgi:hypothetical protein
MQNRPALGQRVFKKTCFAFLNNKINELPVKEKRYRLKKDGLLFSNGACQ